MSYILADNSKEQKWFNYLERLRQSGITNMFGAAPYLARAFREDFTGRNRNEAGKVLVRWMRLHSDPQKVTNEPPAVG